MSKKRAIKYNVNDYIGKQYGKFTIIDSAEPERNDKGQVVRTYVMCRCECGSIRRCTLYGLLSGRRTNCGCNRRTHNLSNTRLYGIFQMMKQRCYNPKNTGYSNYGGRGIYICDEWMQLDKTGRDSRRKFGNPGFLAFYNWAYANGYYDQPEGTPLSELLTIDRIDSNGPYAPWNCRWVTYKVQENNTSSNAHIEDIDGTIYIYSQFDEKYFNSQHIIYRRVARNWSHAAIVYMAHHPELGICKKVGCYAPDDYYDKDGFRILIPTLEMQRRLYRGC